jgi:hypothetical protein
MARQTSAHGGITGADLNAALPTPGAPALANIVGAWVLTAADPAAVAAARILGRPDFRHSDNVVFPLAVLTLFVADAVQHADAPAPAGSATASTSGSSTPDHLRADVQPAGYAAAPITDAPCTTISNFINNVLTTVFNALKLDPATVAGYVSGKLGGGTAGLVVGALASWAASFWNGLVSTAQNAVQSVIDAITGPVLNVLRTVIGGLGTIVMIASYLKQWGASILATPATNRFAVGSETAQTGQFIVTVDPNAETQDWPPAVTDCAAAAGVPLPTLTKAGLPVTWTVLGDEPGLVTVGVAGPPFTTVIDNDFSSTLGYTTGREDAQTAKGTLVAPTVTTTANVRRSEVDDLRKLVTGFITAQVPKVVAPVINPILAYYAELATQQLDKITAVQGSATIVVTHHVKRPPTPSPSASSGNCAGGATTIAAGTYAGPVSGTVTTTLHLSAPGVPNAGHGTNRMTGRVTVTSDGKTVTGTIMLSGSGNSEVGVPGEITIPTTSFGKLIGTISGPAGQPVIDGTLSGSDDAGNNSTNPVHVGLHITRTTCDSISGDLVALFTEITASVRQYLTVGGSGAWTIPRS